MPRTSRRQSMALVTPPPPRRQPITTRRHSMPAATFSDEDDDPSSPTKTWLEFLDRTTLNLLEESTRSVDSGEMENDGNTMDPAQGGLKHSKVFIKNLAKIGNQSLFSPNNKTSRSVDSTLSSTEAPSDATLTSSGLLPPQLVKSTKSNRFTRRFSLSKKAPTMEPLPSDASTKEGISTKKNRSTTRRFSLSKKAQNIESLVSDDSVKEKKSTLSRRSSMTTRALNKSNIIKVQRKLLGKKKKSGKKPSEKEVPDDDEVKNFFGESTQRPASSHFYGKNESYTEANIESSIVPSNTGDVVVHSTDVWLGRIDGRDVSKAWRSVVGEYSLNPRSETQFILRRKTHLGEDSFVLEFALPTEEHQSGVPPGKHVIVSAIIGGRKILRRYTPISSEYDKGFLELLVTALRPSLLYPGGGKMTQYLDGLEIGDYLDFRGPVGDFEYVSNGKFVMKGVQRHASHFNMVATGVRVSSCIQIIAHILCDRSDPTTISLIYVVAKEEDILMRSRLEKWANDEENKFKLHYVLSEKWPAGWRYSTGKLRKALFAAHFAEPSDGVYNLMSAQPSTLERYCIPALMDLGHARDNLFAF